MPVRLWMWTCDGTGTGPGTAFGKLTVPFGVLVVPFVSLDVEDTLLCRDAGSETVVVEDRQSRILLVSVVLVTVRSVIIFGYYVALTVECAKYVGGFLNVSSAIAKVIKQNICKATKMMKLGSLVTDG